jgi:UPF0755 protein
MKFTLVVISVFAVAFLGLHLDRSHRLGGSDAIQMSYPLKLYSDMSIDSLIVVMQADTIDFDPESLKWAASELRFSTVISGRYVFEEATSNVDFLTRLVKGRQDPVQLLVPTARFLSSVSSRIGNQMRFSAAEFDSTVRDSAFLAELGVKPHHIVGRLLPDTYEFYWTATPEEVITRIHNTFKERVENRFASRLDSLGWTVDQATTMASIIEWEVKHVDEMSRVSGLYWNRLRVGMPLQADPTVNFAIGERRRLYFSDYRFNHPYNTYRHRGLPPGPLNNPRLVAIEAALYPDQHGYFFMVANPEGYHTFTRTFTEHKIEARKWSKWLNEQVKRREQAAATTVAK